MTGDSCLLSAGCISVSGNIRKTIFRKLIYRVSNILLSRSDFVESVIYIYIFVVVFIFEVVPIFEVVLILEVVFISRSSS